MKAVILVGGEATRLLPLTRNIPKAVVPVLNIPFLEHVLRHLRTHQITDITLALSHLSQPIQSYLGDGRQLNISVAYTLEDTPRGTAGAVKMSEKNLSRTFLVLNGDIFTDLDISAMIAFHRERKAKATIALTPVADPTSYGLIETGDGGRVTRFLEKPTRAQITTNMVNAGTYVLEPEVLKYIPPQTKFSFERELFPQLLERGEPVYAYPSSAYWIDIGTPQKYLQLNLDLLRGGVNPHAAPGELRVGEHCFIHPTAEIRGAIVIGDHCTIGPGVKLSGPTVIGPGSTILDGSVIEASVIWRDVRVGPQVSLKNSIVADNCCLHDRSVIVDSILGDNVTVTSGAKLKPGSKVWPGTVIPL